MECSFIFDLHLRTKVTVLGNHWTKTSISYMSHLSTHDISYTYLAEDRVEFYANKINEMCRKSCLSNKFPICMKFKFSFSEFFTPEASGYCKPVVCWLKFQPLHDAEVPGSSPRGFSRQSLFPFLSDSLTLIYAN